MSCGRLSWALQGSGIGLLVVPDLADIAGPRIEVNPVEGLPLSRFVSRS